MKRIPAPSGRLSLMLAIAIFGAANAITRRLTELGAANTPIGSHNPVSFCNVLFVGNLCALLLLLPLYQHQWRRPVLRQVTTKQWLNMILVAVLGAAAVPTLIFTALSITTVNNVVLVGQIDTPLVLALSVLLLRERVNAWVIAGALVSFIGVVLTVVLQPPGSDMVSMGMGISIGRGELLTLVAAVLKAIANVISKAGLAEIPLGVFSIFRMVVGTVFFFAAALIIFDAGHFMDVTSPFLWRWMLLYSAVIVVGGQLFWFSGLRQSSASEISLATAFTPLAGVLAAYLILAEAPTVAQYIGGSVILVGIALNQIGVRRLNARAAESGPMDNAIEEPILYKGL